MFASNRQLLIHTQQHIQHLQQYDKQEQQQLEAEALQAAFETSTANLMAIQEDQLLAGELSALCGYWLVRHLLPQLATGDHTGVAVRGFRVLQELRYQVGVRCVSAAMQHMCTQHCHELLRIALHIMLFTCLIMMHVHYASK